MAINDDQGKAAKGFSDSALILGVCLIVGLFLLGRELASGLVTYREMDRTVTVKGLSENEYPSDIVIWPIQFISANNNLADIYTELTANTQSIRSFLLARGIEASEISQSPPSITDKLAQQWGGGGAVEYRYTATQTVTVYSVNVDAVRKTMNEMAELGKQGIVFTSNDYEAATEYIFTQLNDIKPRMVEEATKQAREVADKFAQDSGSQLGKIKSAQQGQFTIESRDKNNPHIKKVRVVSTVEYYLSD